MTISITFLGAAGTVTGSKYLVSGAKKKILIDVGLFQGSREWRERNWHKPDIDLQSIDAACLTHAHIDHIGLLPRYVTKGLKCPVFCTPSTLDLSHLLLKDSGRLQEQEALYRSERGKSRHKPPLPLYTEKEADHACTMLRSTPFHTRTQITDGVYATWHRMGHILGAGCIQLEIDGKLITFSGDIGRYGIPILVDPEPVTFGNLLLVESTYGDRLHADHDPKARLADVINRTAKRGGVVVIPSFAVGRAQLLLFYLRELKAQRSIPDIPIILDSPMASDATKIYKKHPADYDEHSLQLLGKGTSPFEVSKMGFVRDTKDSIKLNSIDDPMVIISASGMLSGGRILHHLKHRISDPRNTILFVGFQPPGGRGDWILSGAETVRLFGTEFPIRAEVTDISGLSAHADKDELLRWCRSGTGVPDLTAIVHGEQTARENFATTLRNELGWQCAVPKYLETITI